MSESAARVREILLHLEREGDLPRISLPGASLHDLSGRVIPPWVLVLLAIQTAVVDELGGLPEDGSVGEVLTKALAHTQGLEHFEVADLEGMLIADVVRSSHLDVLDGMTWGSIYRLLGGLVSARRMSSVDIDDLLERAEALWRQALGEGLLLEPRVRSGEYGPWDVSESWSPETERLTVGSLRVPVIPGVGILPYRVGDRTLGAIAKLVGRRCLLQAFPVASSGKTWDSSRRGLIQSVVARGGQAEEASNALGPEVRARIPATEDEGRRELKFVGCDGPGWILRGMVSGIDAMADVIDGRFHYFFTRTVVDLRDTDGTGD